MKVCNPQKNSWHEIIKVGAEINKMKTNLKIQRNNETELDL